MTTYKVTATLHLRGYLDTYSIGDIEIDMSDTDGVDVHDQSVEAGDLEARLDLRFDIEAESQAKAEEKADAVFDNMDMSSGDNIEWEYESHDVESVEGPPMDSVRAKEIILEYLTDDVPEEVQEALRFLLDLI